MDIKERYIQALCKELEMRKSYLGNVNIATIYLGGGTPSQLGKEDFEKIFKTIKHNYQVNNDAEITLEANPDDLTEEYVEMLTDLPFNRISMGVQTFNDKTLKILNRRHSSQQAKDAVKRCQAKGFKNISIDLIYGLPNESYEEWTKDLKKAIDLNIQHISAYHLIYEEGTKLHKLLMQKNVTPVSEVKSVDFFKILIHQLKDAGFEHYEISNFCQPNFHSKHNSSYWLNEKYMGCGPSAHSYNLEQREWNISSLSKYIESINKGERDFEVEELPLDTRYNDLIITSLRTMWGLDTKIIKERLGDEYYDYCIKLAKKHIESNNLTYKNGVLSLTEKGVFVSDGIMSDLLWVD